MTDERRVRTMAGWIGVEISRSRVRTEGKAGFGMYRVRPAGKVYEWTAYAFTLEEIERGVNRAIGRGNPTAPYALKLPCLAPGDPNWPAITVPTRWTSAYRGRRNLGTELARLERTEPAVAEASSRYDEMRASVLRTAECGCPNNLRGEAPVLHRCSRCGFEGGYESVHERCSGCAYPVAVRPEYAAELDALVVLLDAGVVQMKHVEGCACDVPGTFTAACVRKTMPDRMMQRAQNAAFQAEHLKAREHGLRARYAAKRARGATTQPVATSDGSTAI